MTTSTFNAESTRRFIVMLVATTVCFAAGYARADDGAADDVRKVVVSLAGINMSTFKGANMVYGRIRNAAEVVCGVGESRDLAQVRRARVCFRSSVDDAIAQVNRPLLSELHARRMGAQAEMVRSASR